MHKPTYQTFQDMHQRCYNKNAQQFKNYGARGIAVCDAMLERRAAKRARRIQLKMRAAKGKGR